MTTQLHITLARATALTSFLLGSIIFGLYFMTSSSELLFFGYAFIVLAALINIIILLMLLIRAKKDTEGRSKLIYSVGLMFLNIPVMISYCWVAIILIGTMRITFINASQITLNDINIVGCGGGYIKELKVGDSETVWIKITGDCSLNINYLNNNQRLEEKVAGYITSGMGGKIDHLIDGHDKDIF